MIELSENYRVTLDESCYTLEKKRIAKTGKNIGAETWDNVSYHRDLKSALKKYREIGKKDVLQAHTGVKLDQAVSLLDEHEKSFKSFLDSLILNI